MNRKMVISGLIVLLSSSVWAGDRVSTSTYTAAGLINTIDGPRIDVSDVTSYTYDAQNRVATITNALNQITRITQYDGNGRPLTMVDVNGITTTLTYNDRGWLVTRTVKHPTVTDGTQDAITTFVYDGVGQVTQVISPDGNTLTYTYDDARRLTRITDALGNYVSYTLDAMGNITAENTYSAGAALLRAHTSIFDELGRMIKDINANNQFSQLTYNANNQATQVKDANLNTTTSSFDALMRLAQTTDAANGLTKYEYDTSDRITKVTDPRGVITQYTYDGLGNKKTETSSDRGITVFNAYDEAGNLLQKTLANGQVINYIYDALNRLTQISYVNAPTETVTFTYDDIANGNYGAGRLTGMVDQYGATLYQYNHLGSIISQSRQIAGRPIQTVQFAYDKANHLIGMTYPSGRILNYGYDNLGRINQVSIKDNALAIPTTLSNNFTYLPFGPVTGFTYGNGSAISKTFDQNYRLINQTINSIQKFTLGYDAIGNILTSTDNLVSGLSQTFSYDSLYRVKTASQSGGYGSHVYNYDATGNRINQTIGSASTTYTMQLTSNRITNQKDTYTWVYTYDNNGNITSKTHPSAKGVAGEGWYYTYSALNRLTKVDQEVHTVSGSTTTKTRTTKAVFTYNGKGERISKTAGTTTTYYLYGLNGELVQEEDTSSNKAEYLYLNGELLVLNQTESTAVTPLGEDIFVDNGGTGTSSTGTWAAGTNTSDYGANYLTAAQSASNTYTWAPTLSGGSYNVYAWWVATKQNTTAATYTITHNGIIDTVTKNQTATGGQWVLLGTYTFASGNNHSVKVSAANGKTVADAIRFTQNVTPTQQLVTSSYYVHNDQLGTPKFATKTTGQVAWKATYTPFGSATVTNDVDGDGKIVKLNARFPGQYYDQETGLHYNATRDYDPSTGRYLQPDSIGLQGGLNLFSYTKNNPVNYVDPDGRIVAIPLEGAILLASAVALIASLPKNVASNDECYGSGGDNCEKWRNALNRVYLTLAGTQQGFVLTPDQVAYRALLWGAFWANVTVYETVCGPYTPPPDSIHDIYGK